METSLDAGARRRDRLFVHVVPQPGHRAVHAAVAGRVRMEPVAALFGTGHRRGARAAAFALLRRPDRPLRLATDGAARPGGDGLRHSRLRLAPEFDGAMVRTV